MYIIYINMFEIYIDNNENAINELLGNQSKFLDPDVVDDLKMLRDKKKQTKLHCDEYDSLSFDAYYFQQIASSQF